jgi:AcrR family transcriptional regulator
MASGLRERKRATLARELARTAYALVEANGFAAATVDRIVDAAGVSRRTFSTTTPARRRAAAAVALHRPEDGLASWSLRPIRPDADLGGVDLVSIVRDLVAHQLDSGTFASVTADARMSRDHPQLVPYVREAHWRLWTVAGARVLAELGDTDPTRRSELTAIIGAVFGVVSHTLIPAVGESGEVELPALRARLAHILDRPESGFGG